MKKECIMCLLIVLPKPEVRLYMSKWKIPLTCKTIVLNYSIVVFLII